MSESASIPSIAVVILNYNNYEDTAACLSCFEGSCDNISLIVVDNCSTDDSLQRLDTLLQIKPHITLIASPDNRGYAAGNNQGIRRALEMGCDYICILNNDTILDPHALITLANYLRDHTECIMVGPLIRNNDAQQTVQSAGAQINLWTGNVNPLHSKADPKSLSREIECGYISGACIMFRSKDIHAIGFIPEDYFLYFEETEWCLRAGKNLGKIICLTDASIIHLGSATTAKMGSLTEYLMTRNRAAFERRNASAPQLISFCLFTVLSCMVGEVRRHDGSLRLLSFTADGLFGKVRPSFAGLPIKA